MTDTGGNVLERYSYDADGNVTVCDRYWTPVTDNVSQYGTTILFAGCQLDTNTGLYLMGARWYDPGLNRFISRDPLGYLGSPVNLYTYCGDNPVGSTDPSGLSCELGTYYTPNSSSSGYVDCSELVVETEGNPGGGGGLAGAGRGSAADFSKYGADAPGDSAGDLVSILVGRGNNSSGGYVLTANEADGGNSSDGGGAAGVRRGKRAAAWLVPGGDSFDPRSPARPDIEPFDPKFDPRRRPAAVAAADGAGRRRAASRRQPRTARLPCVRPDSSVRLLRDRRLAEAAGPQRARYRQLHRWATASLERTRCPLDPVIDQSLASAGNRGRMQGLTSGGCSADS